MYLLDANIFITAKNLHYGFDFVPGFWEWLDQGRSAGIVCSTDQVRRELTTIADELSTWTQGRESMFLKPDKTIIPSMQRLAMWSRSGRFSPAAADEFLRAAGFELVAYAHAHDHIVVTHERPNPSSKRKISIPDACEELGVKWINPYQMLRSSGARFVLAPAAS